LACRPRVDSSMKHGALTTYLNDHLAGSVAALELLDHLIGFHEGAADEQVLISVRAQVGEDQKVLQRLIQDLGATESRVRQAAAWLTEKLGQAKLRLEDAGDGGLHTLEALEALALGIQGKSALWRALSAASTRVPELRGLDFDALDRRALDQFRQIDNLRLQAAPAALSL
jgi:hypothetical protein